MGKQTKLIHVEGNVFSGTGKGAKFAGLPWVKSQIKEKLGFIPHPGTLNIRLTEKYMGFRKLLEKGKSIEIVPKSGYCRGKCFKAYIMDCLEGAIVIPEVEGYPENVLEVIAPINLRDRLRLKDGDKVEITVVLE